MVELQSTAGKLVYVIPLRQLQTNEHDNERWVYTLHQLVSNAGHRQREV